MLEEVAAIIGCVTGVLSLAGVVYLIGYWKGGIDTWKKSHEEEHKKYPPSETALMCKTMWDIFIVAALKDRPDLATHQSPYRLTPQGQDLIPQDVKDTLCQIPKEELDREAIANGWLVVSHLGLERIEAIAHSKKLSVPEAVAIFSTFLENHTNHY
jgi:hypothetical protein